MQTDNALLLMDILMGFQIISVVFFAVVIFLTVRRAFTK